MIARELLIKFGFDIDEAGYARGMKMVDNLKSKTQIIPNARGMKMVDNLKSKTQIIPNVRGIQEINGIRARQAGLKKLNPALSSTTEKMLAQFDDQVFQELKGRENNLIKNEEKRVATEVKRAEFFKQTERKKFTNLNGLKTLSRKIALMSAAVGGILALNTRGTLNDVADFKKTGKTKSGNVFTNKQIWIANTFNRSLKSLSYSIKEVRNSFIMDLLPPLNEVLVEFKIWIEKNQEFIKARLGEVITGIAAALKLFLIVSKKVATILDDIIEPTIGWKNAITGLVAIGLITWVVGLVAQLSLLLPLLRAIPVVFTIIAAHPVIATITAITLGLGLMSEEIKNVKKESIGLWRDAAMLKPLIEAREKNQLMASTSQNKLGFWETVGAGWDKAKPSFLNSNSTMNTTNRNSQVLNQRNSFNITVNTPVGTSQEQSKFIVNLVQKEIAKTMDYQNERALIAVGVHN